MARLAVCLLLAGLCSATAHMPEVSGLAALLRLVMGGGPVRDVLHEWLLGGTPNIKVGTQSEITTLPNGWKEQTFLSLPMGLKPGEIKNDYMPIPWPTGHIAVKAFTADLVKDVNGAPPPPTPCCGGPTAATRNEAYLHHWTINKWQLPGFIFKSMVKNGGIPFEETGHLQDEMLVADAGMNTGANGPCPDGLLHTYFGVGNEVRGRPYANGGTELEAYEFPDPYAVVFDGDQMRKDGQFMILNNHIIDIRNVTDRRGCSECDCKVTGVDKGSRYLGGLSCCHSTSADGGKCSVGADTDMTEQRYYIKYTLKWREFSSDVKPLEVMTLEMSDDNTQWSDIPAGGFKESHEALKSDPALEKTIHDQHSGVNFMKNGSCHIEYFVPPCSKGETCVHNVHNSWEMPFPVDVVFVRHHFHVGGLNQTLSTKNTTFCESLPKYGSEGFLNDISTCAVGKKGWESPVRVEQGDRLISRAMYQQDDRPHYGVMGFSVVYAHRLKWQTAAPGFLV